MTIELLKSSSEDNIYTAAEAWDGKFSTVVANEKIASGMEYGTLKQSCCALHNQGVKGIVLTLDASPRYGVAIGSVIKTNGSIFPDNYVGDDIVCMRAILTSLTEKDLQDRREQQNLVEEIKRQIPTGTDCQPSTRSDEETTRDILRGRNPLDDTDFVELFDLSTDMLVEEVDGNPSEMFGEFILVK